MALTLEQITKHTHEFMAAWMKDWTEASEAAVERMVSAYALDGVKWASPFSVAKGYEGIRTYESMILTQRNGKAKPYEFLGVAGNLSVARWEIEYDVIPKTEWSSKVPQRILESPEWQTFNKIPFSSNGNRIRQAGIATVEFNEEGFVTELREYWETKIIS